MKYSQLIPIVNKILSEYTMKLTLRQIYYRLVADYGYPNKRASYNQLSSQLVKAREKGQVNKTRIEDRTRSFLGGDSGWKDADDFETYVKDYFLDYWKEYEKHLWMDQEYFVVIWVEKDALSRVVATAADKYRVITAPSRGYASYTYIRDAIARLPKDKKIVILHFSDHDPSGLDMTRDLQDRFWRYTRKEVKVERVALSFDQVQEYQLAPNPTKKTDTRAETYMAEYGMECWELDAIEPKELERLVLESIERYVDLDQWQESLDEEEQNRAELKTTFESWRAKLEEA